jgi:hypothetical protein
VRKQKRVVCGCGVGAEDFWGGFAPSRGGTDGQMLARLLCRAVCTSSTGETCSRRRLRSVGIRAMHNFDIQCAAGRGRPCIGETARTATGRGKHDSAVVRHWGTADEIRFLLPGTARQVVQGGIGSPVTERWPATARARRSSTAGYRPRIRKKLSLLRAPCEVLSHGALDARGGSTFVTAVRC